MIRIPDAAQPFKDKTFSVDFYQLMVRARVLEERLIMMVKAGEGYFWIGGPGEEAFNIALGLQTNKGQGVAHDYLHLHYRSNAVALAMGMPMIEFVRQMANRATDPFSGGRNFASHIAYKPWNIVPVTSTIETQYLVSIGTAMAQRTERGLGHPTGITIVTGGDAGTAEGDFASCLVWSSRPDAELPNLVIVTNNQYGISTPASTQHGEKNIAERGKAFGIESVVIDGNTPEKAWHGIETAMQYVRETGRPYLLEARVSRLYGHSSSSGANRVEEQCPIQEFEKKLLKQGWLDGNRVQEIWQSAKAEAQSAWEQVKAEPRPDPSTVYHHTFSDGNYGGIPGRDF